MPRRFVAGVDGRLLYVPRPDNAAPPDQAAPGGAAGSSSSPAWHCGHEVRIGKASRRPPNPTKNDSSDWQDGQRPSAPRTTAREVRRRRARADIATKNIRPKRWIRGIGSRIAPPTSPARKISADFGSRWRSVGRAHSTAPRPPLFPSSARIRTATRRTPPPPPLLPLAPPPPPAPPPPTPPP